MSPLRFYFDFISPYAYIAWKRLPALAARHGRLIDPVPVLFAGLLDHHGQKGPAEMPAKRLYTFKDAYRKAHAAGLTLRLPPAHPFKPLLALRVAGLPEVPDRPALIDALYDAVWATGEGADTPERVAAAASRVGLDGPALVAASEHPEAKARLRSDTEEAIAAGVFGVPTISVGGELFWGVDSLPFLEDFLLGRDPVPPDAVERWAALPAGSVRPGMRARD